MVHCARIVKQKKFSFVKVLKLYENTKGSNPEVSDILATIAEYSRSSKKKNGKEYIALSPCQKICKARNEWNYNSSPKDVNTNPIHQAVEEWSEYNEAVNKLKDI